MQEAVVVLEETHAEVFQDKSYNVRSLPADNLVK